MNTRTVKLLHLYLALRRMCEEWIGDDSEDDDFIQLVSLQAIRDEVAGLHFEAGGKLDDIETDAAINGERAGAHITQAMINRGIEGLGAIGADDLTAGDVVGRVASAFFQSADDPYRFMGAFNGAMREATAQG